MEKITIEVPRFYRVQLGSDRANSRVYGAIDVDLDKMAANAVEHLVRYGVTQNLNDACATKKDKNGVEYADDEIVAFAQKRLDNLYAGQMRAARSPSESPIDPVEIEYHRLITQLFAKPLAKIDVPKGTKKSERFMVAANILRTAKGKPELDSFDEFVADQEEFNPDRMNELRKQAEANVAQATADAEEAENFI